MHKFGASSIMQAENNIKKSGRSIPSAEEEAEEGAYRLESGELCQPAEHIYQAMCKAAGDFLIKGKNKKTYRGVVAGNVVISPEFIGHGTDKYGIDARPVGIQKSRILRRRPWLKSWLLEFEISVLDEELLPREVLNSILVTAGQTIGIGDYRPRFGRFIVEEFA